MNELAIVVSNDNHEHVSLTIDAIKEAGFKNVFIQWYEPDGNFEVKQRETLKMIKEAGLHVVFAHLGYHGINNIWLEGEKGDSFVDRYIKDLRDLNKEGIDTVVMHLQSKWEAPEFNEIGLNRLRKIIAEANKLNMKIAFENTKLLRYVTYVMKNIKDKNIGVCIDVGHGHCNSKDQIDIPYYKNRVLAVHLHDNNGESDEHKIPFDGDVDWKFYLKGLKDANYKSYFTFEQCTKHYDNIDIYEFYRRSYKAGLKLLKIYEEI